jgi:hypothetical protein
MPELAQIVVQKRRGKWWLKAPELCDTFPDQLTAIKAGIFLAPRGRKAWQSVSGPLEEERIQDCLEIRGGCVSTDQFRITGNLRGLEA